MWGERLFGLGPQVRTSSATAAFSSLSSQVPGRYKCNIRRLEFLFSSVLGFRAQSKMHNAFGSGLSLPAPVCLHLLLFFVIVNVFALWVVVGWMQCHGVTSGSAVRVWIVLISSFKIRLIRGMIRSHNEIIINDISINRLKERFFFFCGEWVYPLTILTVLLAAALSENEARWR